MVQIARINMRARPKNEVVGTDKPALRADPDSTLEGTHAVQHNVARLAELIVTQVFCAWKVVGESVTSHHSTMNRNRQEGGLILASPLIDYSILKLDALPTHLVTSPSNFWICVSRSRNSVSISARGLGGVYT